MNEPKRRGPKRKLEIDAKCKICGKLATAIHYNCVSCEGCKGFFRRTVVHKKIYPECKLPTPCEIAVKGKRACQWCRYKKCIAQGMKAEMVTVTTDDIAGPPVKVETHENRLNINLMEKIKSEQGFVSPRVPTQVQEQLSNRFSMKNESFQKTQDHSQVQLSQQRSSFEKAPLNPRIPSNQTSHRVKHDSRGSVSDDGSQTVSMSSIDTYKSNSNSSSPLPKKDTNPMLIRRMNLSRNMQRRFKRVNNPDYEKTINHIRISYQRCCEQRRNEFPETPFKSESTADGWRSRFTHFSELTIGAIKTLVTFVSTVRPLDELQPSTKLTITKDSLLALMIIKCSLEYIISEDRVRFMNGETYDQNSYIAVGIPSDIVKIHFSLCKQLKKLVGNDYFLTAITSVIRILNANTDLSDTEVEKIKKLKMHFTKILEYYCITRDKPLLNVELMMYLGDLALGELNLLKFIMDLKKAQLNNPFVLLDSLMENWLDRSKNVLPSDLDPDAGASKSTST